jgi:hypothetical protein
MGTSASKAIVERAGQDKRKLLPDAILLDGGSAAPSRHAEAFTT